MIEEFTLIYSFNRPKQQPWFTTEIRALIEKRDSAYKRWKRFWTDDLKALHKSARSEVTRHIKIVTTLYYGRKFSNAMDNKSKWNGIREIGIGGKYPKNDFVVGVNKLNDQFVRLGVPTSVGNSYDDLFYDPQYSFSFRLVDHFEVLECISPVISNAIARMI